MIYDDDIINMTVLKLYSSKVFTNIIYMSYSCCDTYSVSSAVERAATFHHLTMQT